LNCQIADGGDPACVGRATTGETITYGYNANGDQTSMTVKTSGGTIVRQQSAVFDELGRLMKAIGTVQSGRPSIRPSENL